jgi:hypothetical protein
MKCDEESQNRRPSSIRCAEYRTLSLARVFSFTTEIHGDPNPFNNRQKHTNRAKPTKTTTTNKERRSCFSDRSLEVRGRGFSVPLRVSPG